VPVESLAAAAPQQAQLPGVTQLEIDQRVFDLYDEYCHGGMDRRAFLQRAAAVTVGGLAMAQALLPRYAQAQTVSFTDPRIKARYVTYPSPGGCSGTMRGYPGNDDRGRALQAGLDQGKLRTDMLNSARYLLKHQLSSGKLGVTGFCWGGGTTNYLAVTLGADMKAGVPYYGAAAETASVPSIKASLLIQYAENDQRINDMWPTYEGALKAANVPYEVYFYSGTQHGFHNNSTPRYNEAQAKISWDRTVAFFKKNLA